MFIEITESLYLNTCIQKTVQIQPPETLLKQSAFQHKLYKITGGLFSKSLNMENYTKIPSKSGIESICDNILCTDFITQFQYGIEDNKVFLKISQI